LRPVHLARNHGGLAIIYKESFEPFLSEWAYDPKNRFIAVNINGDKENNPFFEKLTTVILKDFEKLSKEGQASPDFIVAGDMNAKINPSQGFKDFMSNIKAKDAWREEHLTVKSYTYRAAQLVTNDTQQTRIDVFIIPSRTTYQYQTKIHEFDPNQLSGKKSQRRANQFSENYLELDNNDKAQLSFSRYIKDIQERIAANFPLKQRSDQSNKNQFTNHEGIKQLKWARNRLLKLNHMSHEICVAKWDQYVERI